MRNSLVIFALLSLGLAGCTEPTIDGSSEAAFKQSVKDIQESLPENKSKEFSSAVVTVTMGNVDFASIMKGEASTESMIADTRASLDGKNAEQVIEEANRIAEIKAQRKAEREARERKQALEEIADLEEEKAEAEKAKEQLKGLKISKSRLYKRDGGFRAKPIIEMTVTNNTEKPIARAFFDGVVYSPDRSVPWIEETFNYQIPGGLEPGETAEWTLAPNMFSEWATDVPSDAILTLTTYKLEGPGYELSSKSFSDRDADRLLKLKEQYEN